VLQGVMFDQLCRDLMDALLVGFSVVEVIWTVRDNLVVPKRFAKRPSGASASSIWMTNSRPRCAW
jgi:phage gp29-like protein